MKTTRIIVPFAALAIVLTIASGAFARGGMGHGMGHGMGANNYGGQGYGQHMGAINSLTPERQAQLTERMRDFTESNQTLRNDLAAAQLELQALSGNPNAKPERISELAKTVATLRGKLETAHRNHMLSIEKDFGIRMPMGAGYGMGGQRMGSGKMGRAGYMNGNMPGKGYRNRGPRNSYHNGPHYGPRFAPAQPAPAPQNS